MNRFGTALALLIYANTGSNLLAQSKQPSSGELDSLGYKLASSEAKRINSQIVSRLTAIAKANGKAQWRRHARLTIDLLGFTRHVPVAYLGNSNDLLLTTLKKYGCEPFLSYILDYGTRLATIRTKSSLKQFDTLRKGLNCKAKAASGRVVFLRNRNRRSFSGYSDNVGGALVRLAFSDVGRDELLPRAMGSGGLVRMLSAIDACQSHQQEAASAGVSVGRQAGAAQASTRTSASLLQRRPLDTCYLLLDRLADVTKGGLGDGPMGDLGTGVRGLCSGGFSKGGDCLSSLTSDPLGEAVQRLEDYTACRNAENTPSPNSPNVLGAVMASGGSETFDRWGKTGVNSGSRETITNKDGTSTALDHQRSTSWDADGKLTRTDDFTETTYAKDGTQTHSYSETITYSEKTGEITTSSFESTFNPNTGTTTETTTSSIQGVGSTSGTIVTDSQGNQTSQTYSTTIEFSDGSTTTYTTSVDAQGNVTSTESSTPATTEEEPPDAVTSALPPDESAMASHCSSLLHEDPKKAPQVDPLTPLINPNPDQVTSDKDFTACLPDQSSPTHCVSYALCVEGANLDSCNCAPAREHGNVPAGAKQCASTMCAEGSSCDPATGMCNGGGGSDSLNARPGLQPPLGPQEIDCNTTIICRAGGPAQAGVWTQLALNAELFRESAAKIRQSGPPRGP